MDPWGIAKEFIKQPKTHLVVSVTSLLLLYQTETLTTKFGLLKFYEDFGIVFFLKIGVYLFGGLWVYNVYEFFRELIEKKNKVRNEKLVHDSILKEYLELPESTRFLIGTAIVFELVGIRINILTPGFQELLNKQWGFYNKPFYYFHIGHMNLLKSHREAIVNDYDTVIEWHQSLQGQENLQLKNELNAFYEANAGT